MNHDSEVRVLYVDDDPAMTRLVAAKLRDRGIEVTGLHDPTRAVETMSNENYRIILLDIDMPGLDGIELLQRIKQVDGGTAVIMLTGIVSHSSALRAMRRGAYACYFKPLVDFEALVECIQEVDRNNRRWWNTLVQLSEMRRQDRSDSDAEKTSLATLAER